MKKLKCVWCKKEFFKNVPKEKRSLFLKFSKIHAGAKIATKTLSKKYPLYIASNHIDFIFEEELKQIKLKEFFKDFIVSKNIGLAKPDKKFYEYMLKLANVKAKESIFIDDTKTNLETAKKLGINTIWVNNNDENKRNDISYKPDFEISNLKELIKIVSDLND
jgi:putative hydrolase of the HAD superfamily